MARLRPGSIDLKGLADGFWATSRVNRIAILAGVLWAVLVLAYAGGYFGGTGGQARGTAFLDAVFFLVALLLPLGLVWLAAWLAAELARQRAAVAELVAASTPLIEALAETRGSLAQDGPLAPRDVERIVRVALVEARAEIARDVGTALAAPLGELREGQRRLEAAVSIAGRHAAPSPAPQPAASRPAPAARARPPRAPAPDPEEPELPTLEPEPEPDVPLDWDDLIRALDFPRDADDQAGFEALRRALRHRNLQQMLQAAEDVMNLLSQEGVFMDDLEHRPGPAWAWRSFIDGRRGDVVDAVGGIRDERALETVRGLMKSDPIFRDTVLVFQRRFDTVLADIAREADDAGLLAVADTRSGRAFMLCARVSGSFG